MKTIYHPESRTFTMSKGSWSNTYPISQLQKWLDFYREQQVRFPKYATFYDDDIEALEHLARSLQDGLG